MSYQTLGTANPGVGVAQLMISSIAPCTDGFATLCFDQCSLSRLADTFMNITIPNKFAPAFSMRCQIMQQFDRLFRSPFSCSVTTAIPIAFEYVQSNARIGGVGATSYEFNIMRNVDFIGRNFLMVKLPRVDCSEIINPATDYSDPTKVYLGAWHRDLIPRIIRSLSFYSRANNNVLFEYSGYDIYIFNLLFGNASKELNDIMAGEDSFTIGYDPYYVDGAALGLSSVKGINPFKGIIQGTDGSIQVNDVVNSLQIDTTMDNEEFREYYRRGLWFEAPSMKNVSPRHSIHSRRMIHNEKTLWIPLDILPFGYSIASAIPIGAVHGEIGYIHLDIYQNWLDRAFYITPLSDIPSNYNLPNHTHYAPGDIAVDGQAIGSSGDHRVGWVNTQSLGNYANPEFYKNTGACEAVECGELPATKVPTHFGDIVGGAPVDKSEIGVMNAGNAIRRDSNGKFTVLADEKGNYIAPNAGKLVSKFGMLPKVQRKADSEEIEVSIYPLSKVSSIYYEQLKNQLEVNLIQVGYKTLPSIRDLINKLPNIYITTEWNDTEVIPTMRSHIEVLNDLYIEGIVLWFIPEDSNGIESMRIYPNHLIDHELDVINKLRVSNENGQAISVHTWSMLNAVSPSVIGLNHPLPENIGIIPFAPKLVANELPYMFYDTNIVGQLRFNILPFENPGALPNGTVVNMKRGKLRILPIGVNGLVLVNLNWFRLSY